MDASTHTPAPLPTSRILGDATPARRRLLACVDVAVGYVAAQHRYRLAGWRIEAALVECRPQFRGGETVALRAAPLPGASLAELGAMPTDVLRQIAERITRGLDGIANVVPDIASAAPDVEGSNTPRLAFDDDDWLLGAYSA